MNRTRSQLLVFLAAAILSSQAFLAPSRLYSRRICGMAAEVYANAVEVSESLVPEEEASKPTLIELTDWFAEARRYFQGDETKTMERSKGVHSNKDPKIDISSVRLSRGSVGARQEDLLPLRIQRKVGHLWHDINDRGRMRYLSEGDRRRIKKTLITLAAFRSLSDHPMDILNKRTAMNCFEAADVNKDGQLSFEEFLRWYTKSERSRSVDRDIYDSKLIRSGRPVHMKELFQQYHMEKERKMVDHEEWENTFLHDLDRCTEIAKILLEKKVDVETILAGIATHFFSLSRHANEELDIISSQCGPIVSVIVSDTLRLQDIFGRSEPTRSLSFSTDGKSIETPMDLDHQNALLAREYLFEANRDARAFIVHMASLIYTLRSHRLPAHEQHIRALEALQLHVPVSHALGLGSDFTELEELSFKALFPETYSKFALWHRRFMDNGQLALMMASEKISRRIQSTKSIDAFLESFEIQGRVKSVVSAFKKLFKRNKVPGELHDMLGIRIILKPKRPKHLLSPLLKSLPPPASDSGAGSLVLANPLQPSSDLSYLAMLSARLCYEVYELIVNTWDEVPGRYKNYIKYPKPNGYKSIHTGIQMVEDSLIAEVQIRTSDMHDEAERGSAAHSLYKGEVNNPRAVTAFRSKKSIGSIPEVDLSVAPIPPTTGDEPQVDSL